MQNQDKNLSAGKKNIMIVLWQLVELQKWLIGLALIIVIIWIKQHKESEAK